MTYEAEKAAIKALLSESRLRKEEKWEAVVRRTHEICEQLELSPDDLRQLEDANIPVRGYLARNMCTPWGWRVLFVQDAETQGALLC